MGTHVNYTGFVGPLWLQLLGIPASIPSFSVSLLVSRLVWGVIPATAG